VRLDAVEIAAQQAGGDDLLHGLNVVEGDLRRDLVQHAGYGCGEIERRAETAGSAAIFGPGCVRGLEGRPIEGFQWYAGD
jgi:hypothetical protein